jgi:hypothetical protein
MRSSGPRGEAIVFPDALSARGRLTRRYVLARNIITVKCLDEKWPNVGVRQM